MLFVCLVFVMLLRLFIAALWSPAGKGLTSWLLFMLNRVFVTFPCGILGQVWYLMVSRICKFYIAHNCISLILIMYCVAMILIWFSCKIQAVKM